MTIFCAFSMTSPGRRLIAEPEDLKRSAAQRRTRRSSGRSKTRAAKSGKAERLFIVQFESTLPGIKGGYSFPMTNTTRIGSHDYQTQVGFFNFAQTIAANPGAEAEQTKVYLNRNGVQVDDDFLVARYARVASEDK
jgi:hypothetical protein